MQHIGRLLSPKLFPANMRFTLPIIIAYSIFFSSAVLADGPTYDTCKVCFDAVAPSLTWVQALHNCRRQVSRSCVANCARGVFWLIAYRGNALKNVLPHFQAKQSNKAGNLWQDVAWTREHSFKIKSNFLYGRS